MAQLKISGGLLARDTLLNLIGQAVPLLVGIVAIPFIVRGQRANPASTLGWGIAARCL